MREDVEEREDLRRLGEVQMLVDVEKLEELGSRCVSVMRGWSLELP